MEKTNELNKFLSYIHMGMSIYRIYYEEIEKLGNEKVANLIVECQEIFKTHEEKITKLINNNKEEATNSLTMAGVMGVYKEKLKVFENPFSICTSALKATNMGLISSLKFLHDNDKLPSEEKKAVCDVISDYIEIEKKWVNHVLNCKCKDI